MVESPTLADRKLVRRFPESPNRLLSYEPPSEKFVVRYVRAHQTGKIKNLRIEVQLGPVIRILAGDLPFPRPNPTGS